MEDESSKTTIFILNKDETFNNNDKTIIQLTHPTSKQLSLFAISDDDSKVYEVVSYEKSKKSLFINDYNKSKAVLNFLTPIDPVFLLLPHLSKDLTKTKISKDSELQLISKVLFSDECKLIKQVANIKGDKITSDESKIASWLNGKFSNLYDFLKTKRFQSEELDETKLNKEVLSVLSQYLTEHYVKKIVEIRKIDLSGNKRKSMEEFSSPVAKKNKT